MTLELRVTARYLGLAILVLGAWLAGMALFAAVDRLTGASNGSADLKAFLLATLVAAIMGGTLVFAGRGNDRMLGQREALLVVSLTWLVGAALAAAPYRAWSSLRPDAATSPHSFDRWADCYFEAMSGLTGTGATVVAALQEIPRSLLLWRALTHWLGGLGIIVLFVAVFPMIGIGARRIYRVETPGPSKEGVTPRIRDTARVLWIIYTCLSLAEIIALRLCGLGWFDAVCHALATVATGGFGTQDANVAAFDSTAVHVVIIAFLVLSGANYGLYYQLFRGNWRAVIKDPELRLYLFILAAASIIVSLSLFNAPPPAYQPAPGEPVPAGVIVRDAVFQVVSVQTTTGFVTADYDQWGFVPKAVLLTLMFIGGCAGSTACGLKVVRVLMAAKIMWNELEHVHRAKVVRVPRLGRQAIDADTKLNTLVYVVTLALLFGAGTAALMLTERRAGVDITSAASAAATTLNGVGPGLGLAGPTRNFAWFTAEGKSVMCLLMVLGRLEVFTLVVLFTPRFWLRE